MQANKRPIANPLAVLREEFDDWAVLFDPDTGNVFGLNPISLFIWKCLDGKNTIDDILQKLGRRCKDVPKDGNKYIKTFVQELIDNGMAGYEI